MKSGRIKKKVWIEIDCNWPIKVTEESERRLRKGGHKFKSSALLTFPSIGLDAA